MIKSRGWVLAAIAAVGLLSGVTPAWADCICPHYSMGQQGGNWFHYATVHDPNCVHLYATGYVADQALSNRNCSTTCAASMCFPLSPDEAINLFFTPNLWTYEQTNTRDKFVRYLDHLNNNIHVTTYDRYTFELFGTVELTPNSGASPFYAIIYRMTEASNAYSTYLGIEISNAGGTPLTGLPQFNAVRTFADQPGNAQHLPVPGLLTVDLGNHRYAWIRMNKGTNEHARFTVCDPPTHTPLPRTFRPEHGSTRRSLVAESGEENTTDATAANPVVTIAGNNWCCKPRKVRHRRCCR